MLIKTILPVHGKPIAATDVVLWDGPPGAGKSLALAEVLGCLTPPGSGGRTPGRVIHDLQLVSPLTEERLLLGLLAERSTGDGQTVVGWDATTGQAVRWMGRAEAWSLFRRPTLSAQAVAQSEFGDLMRLRVARPDFLRPELLVGEVAAIGPADAPQALLHLIPFCDTAVWEPLNDILEKIGGIRVCWDDSQVIRWSLRVGTAPTAGSLRQRMAQFQQMPRLEEQPRSVVTVAAVVLCSLLLPGRLLLWDNAAEGVDPHTAFLLGVWLGQNLRKTRNQWFLAASSEALVRGLMVGGAEVTRVRLRRFGDDIHLRAVDPVCLRAIHDSPWLALQQAESVAVADAVIVTETEVERAVYRLLVDHLVPQPTYWQVVHAYGPAFAPDVYQTIKATGVPVAVTGTLDLLASTERFLHWCQVLSGREPPQEWVLLCERIREAVEGALDAEQLAENRRRVESFLERLRAGRTPAGTLWEETSRASTEKWRAVRSRGLDGLPATARPWAETLLEGLKRAGLFLSPVGTIRNWFADGTAKPAAAHWFEDAIRRLRMGDCPAPLQAAFQEMVTWLRSRMN